MSSAATFWIGVLLLVAGTYGGYTAYNKFSSDRTPVVDSHGVGEPVPDGSMDPGFEVDEIPLTTQTGAPFQLKSLRGKIWVGSMFFSLCEAQCKALNQSISQIQRSLRDEDITWVSITCDPIMDTPAVLKHYSERFEADPRTWKFLTGSEDAVRRVAFNRLKVPFERQKHSEKMALFGRDGKIVGWYNALSGHDVANFKKKVRQLAAEPIPTDDAAPSDEEKASPEEAETPAKVQTPDKETRAKEAPRAGN